jgi:hypothetical protein
MSAPRVANSPERLSILFAVSNNANDVDHILVTGFVAINSTGIVFKTLGDGNIAGKWSALIEFIHNGLFAMSETKLLNLVGRILGGDEAGLAGTAVAAESHGGAFLTVGPTSALVDGASFVGNVVLMNELVGSKS